MPLRGGAAAAGVGLIAVVTRARRRARSSGTSSFRQVTHVRHRDDGVRRASTSASRSRTSCCIRELDVGRRSSRWRPIVERVGQRHVRVPRRLGVRAATSMAPADLAQEVVGGLHRRHRRAPLLVWVGGVSLARRSSAPACTGWLVAHRRRGLGRRRPRRPRRVAPQARGRRQGLRHAAARSRRLPRPLRQPHPRLDRRLLPARCRGAVRRDARPLRIADPRLDRLDRAPGARRGRALPGARRGRRAGRARERRAPRRAGARLRRRAPWRSRTPPRAATAAALAAGRRRCVGGPEAVADARRRLPDVDLVLNALVGAAGLRAIDGGARARASGSRSRTRSRSSSAASS